MPARGDAGGFARLSALFGYGFDRAAIGMVLASLSGEFVRVNDEYCALVGRPAADLVGRPLSVVTHPDDRAQDPEVMRALVTRETETFRAEKRYLRPDGEIVHGRMSVRLVEDETGPLGFFAQVTDTTDLIRAREELAETTERLRLLADASDAVWLYRVRFVPELKVEYASRGIVAMFGHQPEDLYRDPGLILESVHPDDRDAVAAALAPSADPPDRLELRVVRPDGSTVWIDNRMSPLRDESGAVVGLEGFGYIAADRAVQEVVHASAERFRSLVQHGNDVIALVGTGGLVEWMSPSAESVLGASASAYLGRPPADLACPDDVPALASAFRQVEGGGAESVEFRFRHGDGSIRWLEGLVSNLVDDPNVGAYVLTVRDVTDRRMLTDELRRRAYVDEVTGLPNRSAFRQRVASLVASRAMSRRPFAVLKVLVEGLAPIVEVFGHEWAHQLLVVAADRLLPCGGPGAAVARTGEHTLALLLPNDAGLASVTAAAMRVAAAFEPAFLVDDQPFHLDPAVGVAVFPGHGVDADVLLRRSERAARAATERLSGFVVYSAALDDVTTEHITLLGHLREAIDEDHLTLHYQPKVSLASGEVRGAEALVRWQHPEIGVVAPDQFVPLAERSGLIVPLTWWVVDAAVRQLAEWRNAGHDLVVSVNVTPRNLQDAAFPAEVTSILARWDVPPSSLCLELTERAVMTHPEAAVLACARLADAGLRLALDDFGTGQSSFAYIATLPVTELKIDGRFVRHLATSETDTAISRSIIDLGHRLGHVVTAEGVETPEATDRLRDYGCDAAQGFHLGRPMPAADLPAWLAAHVPVPVSQ